MENLNYELVTKEYRSNIDCRIIVTDRDNDEVVFNWQFYADLDWLDSDGRDEVKKDIDKLEKYCNDNNKNWIQDMMSNVFDWNCIALDYIDFAN